jgi:hypothetical protein
MSGLRGTFSTIAVEGAGAVGAKGCASTAVADAIDLD